MSFSTYGKRTNFSVPSQIRCSVGNELRSRDDFTASQQKKLIDMLAKGQRIRPDKGVISCKFHSGPPQDELQCKGPCGLYKHVTEFSKNARKSGHRRWCVKCMEWSESTGGAHIPLPASNNARTQEEHFFKTERGLTLKYSEEESKNAARGESASPSNKIVKHTMVIGSDAEFSVLASPKNINGGASGQLNYDSADELGDESAVARAPHHHLPQMSFRGSRSDAVSFETASAPSNMSTTASVATSVRKTPNPDGMPYTAWGPDGVRATRYKEPTVVSDISSTVASSEASTSRGGWAKSASRKQPVLEPSYLAYEHPDDIQPSYSDDDSDDTM